MQPPSASTKLLQWLCTGGSMFVEPVTLLPQSVSIATDSQVGKLQGFK